MKVSIVMDNMVHIGGKAPFRGEHGLSMLIEEQDHKFLFDCGPSPSIIHNLSLLGVHPKQLSAIILSHGHYDHTGGLAAVLTHAGKPLKIFAHRGIFTDRYARTPLGNRHIGLPFSRDLVERLGGKFIFVDRPVALTERLFNSGPVPRLAPFEQGTEQLVIAQDSGYVPDPLEDDMSLYAATASGLVVIAGCAHAGLINIIQFGMQVTGCSRLRGMIGGTHLGGASADQCQATVTELQRLAPDFIAANHCTGFAMMAKLANVFDKRFVPAMVGKKFDLE